SDDDSEDDEVNVARRKHEFSRGFNGFQSVQSVKSVALLTFFLWLILLLFSFFLSGFLFSDGFLALIGCRSGGLCRFDQLLGSFDIAGVLGLFFFRHRADELLKLFKRRDCLRNRGWLSEIGDSKLIVGL